MRLFYIFFISNKQVRNMYNLLIIEKNLNLTRIIINNIADKFKNIRVCNKEECFIDIVRYIEKYKLKKMYKK